MKVETGKKYSWADYLSWPEWERWELIKGEPFDMSPAPARTHQQILGELFRQIANYLVDKSCEVYMAPFDVKLSPEGDDEEPTVLQPDLIVNCDSEKWTRTGLKGCPALVLEILSPSTALRDRKVKFDLYSRSGVREYWIADPEGSVIEVYEQKEGETGSLRRKGAYGPGDKLGVGILPELMVDLDRVFPGQLELSGTDNH